MQKLLLFLSLVLLSCSNTNERAGNKSKSDQKAGSDSYAVQMAETLLKLYPDIWMIEQQDGPHWSYTHGLISLAMLDLWSYTGDEKYYDYAKKYIDELVDENGIIKTYKKTDYNIDKINSGKVLFTLLKETGDQRYRSAMDTLRAQLKEHPRTQIGGFWHKKRYPHQMWLDGLYMGGPFYARYAVEYQEPESLDETVRWFINMEKVAYDQETGLLYHGWDESREQAWANKETGLSSNFWGRGMGWYAMALVDVLDYVPTDHNGYDSIITIINRLAGAIVKYQDEETGTWYQVLDQGNREGNFLEGSASAMFSYFLLKAVNKSYIDEDRYTDAARKAFEGTVKYLTKTDADKNLIISPVCAVAGLGGIPYRDGSYEYYINEAKRDNDPKAVGPFIMAAIQYEKLGR